MKFREIEKLLKCLANFSSQFPFRQPAHATSDEDVKVFAHGMHLSAEPVITSNDFASAEATTEPDIFKINVPENKLCLSKSEKNKLAEKN